MSTEQTTLDTIEFVGAAGASNRIMQAFGQMQTLEFAANGSLVLYAPEALKIEHGGTSPALSVAAPGVLHIGGGTIGDSILEFAGEFRSRGGIKFRHGPAPDPFVPPELELHSNGSILLEVLHGDDYEVADMPEVSSFRMGPIYDSLLIRGWNNEDVQAPPYGWAIPLPGLQKGDLAAVSQRTFFHGEVASARGVCTRLLDYVPSNSEVQKPGELVIALEQDEGGGEEPYTLCVGLDVFGELNWYKAG